MLTRPARATRFARLLFVGFLIACLGASVTAGPSWADDAPGNAGPKSTAEQFGLTVSWLPTTAPVQTAPGETSHATIWITNRTKAAIPVSILPATSVPGNNGQLNARRGVDKRFSDITYSPNEFVAKAGTTTPVKVTVTLPPTFSPGVYLILGIVHPEPPKAEGNIRTQQEIVVPVTFQVPGPIDASLNATFMDAARPSGDTASHRFPGLPQIQIGSAGTKTLRVLNTSPTALYSYSEVMSTQSPWGKAVFDGHTTGAPNDLRMDVALYFPNLYRDYPVSWSPSVLGVGLAQLKAYAAYHPTPSTTKQTSTSTSVLVISPWYLLVIALYLLVLLVSVRARAAQQMARKSGRRRTKTRSASRASSTPARVARLLLLGLVTLLVLCFGGTLMFAVTSAAGIALAVIGVLTMRVRDQASMSRLIRIYLALAALVLMAAVVTLLVAMFSTSSIEVGIAILAGVGVWILLASLAQWWNESHPDDPQTPEVLPVAVPIAG